MKSSNLKTNCTDSCSYQKDVQLLSVVLPIHFGIHPLTETRAPRTRLEHAWFCWRWGTSIYSPFVFLMVFKDVQVVFIVSDILVGFIPKDVLSALWKTWLKWAQYVASRNEIWWYFAKFFYICSMLPKLLGVQCNLAVIFKLHRTFIFWLL